MFHSKQGFKPKPNPSRMRHFPRSDDLVILEALDMRYTQKLGSTEIGRRLGLTKNAVIGKISRINNEDSSCSCQRPENKDGGMPVAWWRDKAD